MDAFDYIIVGAGSAGCVLAARLTEDPAVRVLLLEAGPEPRNPWIRVPAGVSRLFFPGDYNWGYSTEAEPHLDGRSVYAPRGRTLGGSSAINGMAYVRGQPEDYDQWRQLGNVGWGWSDVLPYFRKSEGFEQGADALHGGTGELSVTSPLVRHPASRDFIEAGVRLGLPRRDDLNTAEQDGVGFLHFTIVNGRRHSAYDAFLAPVRGRPNLSIETGAVALRIEITDRRATGVTYERVGETFTARARGEVIVSAGAFDSPRLLMLSGVGQGETLRDLDIPVVADLKGVGAHLQDHFYVNLTAQVTPGSSLNPEFRGLRKYLHGARYVLRRDGVLSMGTSQAAAFVRALPGADRPDIQVMFRPVSWEFTPQGTLNIGRSPNLTTSFCFLRPHSRGRVMLRSPDPHERPAIQANYLEAQADREAVVAGVEWVRRFFATDPLKSRIVGELIPGLDCTAPEAILAFARRTGQSTHHWTSTCRMGSDPMAVVDDKLRVHGVGGLRVIDASVMPQVPSGNTNAPTIMVAEKGADLIKAAARA